MSRVPLIIVQKLVDHPLEGRLGQIFGQSQTPFPPIHQARPQVRR